MKFVQHNNLYTKFLNSFNHTHSICRSLASTETKVAIYVIDMKELNHNIRKIKDEETY